MPNAYASKICAGKIKDPSGKKRKDWGPKKASKGLAITAGGESGLGRIQKSRMVMKKAKYKKGGLTKWFKEKWVDISSKKPGGGYRECGRKSASQSKRGYPKCVPAARAASMTKGQIRSAVARKRKVSNVGPKPTNVKTIIKRKTGGMAERGSCWEGYKQVGMKKKGNKLVPNCVKANTGIFAEQESSKKNKKPGMESYNGSHIKSDIAGKSVSNKSYEDYYKGMI